MFIYIALPTDTTGLQSSTAVVELNGSITVTCTFATGATSTGCQVTIYTVDTSRWVLTMMNITRQNGARQVKSQSSIIEYKYKKPLLKLKNEVGMAVLKSKQTRVVYRDNQHIYTYSTSLRLLIEARQIV